MEEVRRLPGSYPKGAQLKELLDAGHVPNPSKLVDNYTPEFKSILVSCGNLEDSTEVRTDAPASDLKTHALVAAFAASHGVPVESSRVFSG